MKMIWNYKILYYRTIEWSSASGIAHLPAIWCYYISVAWRGKNKINYKSNIVGLILRRIISFEYNQFKDRHMSPALHIFYISNTGAWVYDTDIFFIFCCCWINKHRFKNHVHLSGGLGRGRSEGWTLFHLGWEPPFRNG